MNDPRETTSSVPQFDDSMIDGPPEEETRLLTFRSGGWVICLAGLICIVILAERGYFVWESLKLHGGERPSRHATNGFDLGNTVLPPELVRRAFGRDGYRSLDSPEDGTGVTAYPLEYIQKHWVKRFLTTRDRVIGVSINGEARAYPQRVLVWHEVVNDVVGGEPILVTYNGPTDGVAVYSRRVGDQVLTFRHSGLVYNSGQLLCNESETASADDIDAQSLWAQLRGQAVGGPLKGTKLKLLPSQLTHLKDWTDRHPHTKVVPGRASLAKKCYKRETYQSYFLTGNIKFPARPLPPVKSDHFDQVLVLGDGPNPTVFFHDEVKEKVDAQGAWMTRWNDQDVRLIYREGRSMQPSVLVAQTATGDSLPSRSALYFGWYSQTKADLPLTP